MLKVLAIVLVAWLATGFACAGYEWLLQWLDRRGARKTAAAARAAGTCVSLAAGVAVLWLAWQSFQVGGSLGGGADPDDPTYGVPSGR